MKSEKSELNHGYAVALLLALAFAIVVVAPMADAEEGTGDTEPAQFTDGLATVNSYEELKSAIDLVEDGQTIRLGGEIQIPDDTAIQIKDKNTVDGVGITLDFNGHNIMGNNTSTDSGYESETPAGVLWIGGSSVILTDTSTELNENGQKGGILNSTSSTSAVSTLLVSSSPDNPTMLEINDMVTVGMICTLGSETEYSTEAIALNVHADSTQTVEIVLNETFVTSTGKTIVSSESDYTSITINGGTYYSMNSGEEDSPTMESTHLTIEGGMFSYDVSWYLDSDRVLVEQIAGELKLYEVVPACTILFQSNGALGKMESQKVQAGVPATINPNTFTWVDHTFIGWNTSKDGTGTPYADGGVIENPKPGTMLLFAQWEENEIPISDVNISFYRSHDSVGDMTVTVIATDLSGQSYDSFDCIWYFDDQEYSRDSTITPSKYGVYTVTVTVTETDGSQQSATRSFEHRAFHNVTFVLSDEKTSVITYNHNSRIGQFPDVELPEHYVPMWIVGEGDDLRLVTEDDRVIQDMTVWYIPYMVDIDISVSYETGQDGYQYLVAEWTPGVELTDDAIFMWRVAGDDSTVIYGDRIRYPAEGASSDSVYQFIVEGTDVNGEHAYAYWECPVVHMSTDNIETANSFMTIIPVENEYDYFEQVVEFREYEAKPLTVHVSGTTSGDGSLVRIDVESITDHRYGTISYDAAFIVTVSGLAEIQQLSTSVNLEHIINHDVDATAYRLDTGTNTMIPLQYGIDTSTGNVTAEHGNGDIVFIFLRVEGESTSTPVEGRWYTTDYANEEIDAMDGYEAVASPDGTPGSTLDVVPGGTFFMRTIWASNDGVWFQVTVPDRPAAPTVIDSSDYTVSSNSIAASEGYQVSRDNGQTWSTSLTDLSPGTTYQVMFRTAATEDSFASLPTDVVPIVIPGSISGGVSGGGQGGSSTSDPDPGPEPGSGTVTSPDGSETTTTTRPDGSTTTETVRPDGSSTVEDVRPIEGGTQTTVTETDSDGNSTTTTTTKTETTTSTTSEDESTVTQVTATTDSEGRTTAQATTTISVAPSDDGTVAVTTDSITEAMAQIDDVTSKTDEIQKTITVKPSGDTAQSVQVMVEPEVMKQVADTGAHLEIAGDVGTIRASPEVATSLSQRESAVSMSISLADKAQMAPAIQSLVGDRPTYQLQASSGDDSIHELGGEVTVTLPYTLSEGESPDSIVVFYVDDDGILHAMPTSYENGVVTFTTDHFSYYTIRYAPSDGEDNTMLYVGAAVAAIIIVAIAAVLVKRRI